MNLPSEHTGRLRRMRLVGIGAGGLDQVTVEGVQALRSADWALASRKRASSPDPLVEARRTLLRRHAPGLDLVEIEDPERDRSAEATATRPGYEGVVSDWHEARAIAWEQALLERPGDVVLPVWGDPGFYDSTIRVVEKVLARGRVPFEWDVIPGVSAVQLLGARHRIVLHEVGQPLLVTTQRRLAEAVEQGVENVAVMLSRDTAGLRALAAEPWHVWWGANLGTEHERLVAGPVGEVIDAIDVARDEARTAAGWVMDIALLRRRD